MAGAEFFDRMHRPRSAGPRLKDPVFEITQVADKKILIRQIPQPEPQMMRHGWKVQFQIHGKRIAHRRHGFKRFPLPKAATAKHGKHHGWIAAHR